MRGDARRFHRRRYYFRWREFVAALNSRRKALSKEKAFVATLDVEHLRQDLGCEGVPPNAMAREYLASHKGYQPQGVESNADIARITQIARPAHSGFTLAAWRREIEAELEAGTGGAARPSSKALTKLAAYVAETEATTERYRFLQQYAQTL